MKKKLKDLIGYLLFFATIAITVTIVLIVYELVNDQSKGIISPMPKRLQRQIA